jgi:NAD(P)-dependent dehydrogenase (short-subunit alcohol dehydrogenase family)
LLEALINEYSSNSFIVKADLSVENEIKKLVDDTIENLSFPDCIINNAGIAESADIKLDLNNWSKMFDKTIDVNLKAPSLIFKEFLKYKREKKIKSRLRFINIASRAAFRGEQQDYISYACSKGGMISLTKTMSRSFGETDNIVAISIAPGFVRTEMAQSFIDKHGEDVVKHGITLDRLTEPKDISPIVSLIVSGKMDHSTGSTIDVNGGSFLR